MNVLFPEPVIPMIAMRMSEELFSLVNDCIIVFDMMVSPQLRDFLQAG